MNIVFTIILVILVFLAVSSGITKLTLMQQDVEIFGKYGFFDAVLIAFGAMQVLGGIFLVFKKTRFIGAGIVALTFLISLLILLLEGNISLSLVTIVVTLLLGLVMKQSWKTAQSGSRAGDR